MASQDLVRFPARINPEVHKDLVAFAEQNGDSINTALNQLLSFALQYALKEQNSILDGLLPDFSNNLAKVKFIVEQYIYDQVMKDFEDLNSSVYLEFIANKFENLDVQDRKLLSDLAYSLASKKAP